MTAPSRRQLGGSLLAAACGAAFAGALVLPDSGEALPAEGMRILKVPSQPGLDGGRKGISTADTIGPIEGIRETRTPSQPSPDAELLAACAEFDALERAYRATDFTCAPYTPEDLANEVERGRIVMAQVPVLNRMVELHAVTHAGHVARARSFALWKPELLEDGPGDFGDCFTSAIVRDLVGLAA